MRSDLERRAAGDAPVERGLELREHERGHVGLRVEARQLSDGEGARSRIVRCDLDHALEPDEAAAAVRFEEGPLLGEDRATHGDEPLATAELVGAEGHLEHPLDRPALRARGRILPTA
jgi:hypothetical protein